MSLDIQKLFKETKQVGKKIKSTKLQFIWQFMLNGNFHKIEMFHSKLSYKRKLVIDAKIVLEKVIGDNDFKHTFKIDGHFFTLTQMKSDLYELRIGQLAFDNLLQQEKIGMLKPVKREEQNKKEKKSSPRKMTQQSAYEYYYSRRNLKENKRDDYDKRDEYDYKRGNKQSDYKKDEVIINYSDIQAIKNAQMGMQKNKEEQEAFERNMDILNNLDIFSKNDNNVNMKENENILNMNIFDNNDNNFNKNQPMQNNNMNFNFNVNQNNSNNQQYNMDSYGMGDMNQMRSNSMKNNYNNMEMQDTNPFQSENESLDNTNQDFNYPNLNNFNSIPNNYSNNNMTMNYGMEMQNNPGNQYQLQQNIQQSSSYSLYENNNNYNFSQDLFG